MVKTIPVTAMASKPKSVDDYIASFPEDTQGVLQKVRAIIGKTIPRAEEMISYAIPTFKVNGTYVVYFAGYKKHISVYPAPTGSATFEKQLAPYRSGQSTAQFDLSKPLPEKLIIQI